MGDCRCWNRYEIAHFAEHAKDVILAERFVMDDYKAVDRSDAMKTSKAMSRRVMKRKQP